MIVEFLRAGLNADFNFTMQFGTNAIFVMSGSSFTVQKDDPLLPTECVWNFQNLGDKNEIVVGEQFFKQFYTVFDTDNAQLGFGISTNSNTDDGPWILFAPEPHNGPSVLMVAGITTSSIVIVAVAAFFVVKAVKASKAKKAEKPANTDVESNEQLVESN